MGFKIKPTSTSTMFMVIVTWLIILLLACTIAGTFVWILWSATIPVIFTKLCVTGWLPTTISWWSAVKLSWLVGTLFGASNHIKLKK